MSTSSTSRTVTATKIAPASTSPDKPSSLRIERPGSDLRSVARAAKELRARREPFLVATVVRVVGSSYRRPGARLLATAETRVAGSVSGGCLERDLLRTGFWRTRGGPVVVRYDSSDPEDIGDVALGCGGVVDVLLERGDDVASKQLEPLRFIEESLCSEKPHALVTVFSSTIAGAPIGTRWGFSSLNAEVMALHDGPPSALRELVQQRCRDVLATGDASIVRYDGREGELEALVEPLVPPPHLFVFGAGVDAIPVAEHGHRLGWNVTVWDPMNRFEARDHFHGLATVLGGAADLDTIRDRIDHVCGRSFCVVMSHNRDHDGRAVALLLGSRAEYIGILGPRHRTESIAEALSLPTLFDDPRVHAPVGIDLGAETAEEIALSITAEMLACARRASKGALRSMPTIHQPPTTR